MKCVVCRHGDTHPGKSTVTLQRDGAVIIIKEVPAAICANCGEYYLSEETTRAMLGLTEARMGTGVEMAIVRFAA